ncbi:MAG: response regulator transcription factor [Anaerolineaceae bacterium]|nr:response regulator transcription factor [Anaerolineaceae bacterium]
MVVEQYPIRVLIVDDHLMVRHGLVDFIDVFDDLELVGQAANGEEAIRLCQTLQPDIVLMDLVMPVMDGITATKKIIQQFPKVRVIALTTFQDDQLVKEALEAGATSFLHKNISVYELGDAIRKAFKGQPALSPEATRSLIGTMTKGYLFEVSFTPREREVLGYMVAGYSNPKIASELSLSLPTVKTHVSNILSKLGVSSRTEAVALALKHKLIS